MEINAVGVKVFKNSKSIEAASHANISLQLERERELFLKIGQYHRLGNRILSSADIDSVQATCSAQPATQLYDDGDELRSEFFIFKFRLGALVREAPAQSIDISIIGDDKVKVRGL